MNITLNRDYLKGFIEEKDYDEIYPKLKTAHQHLVEKTGSGADFTGWMNLPSRTKDSDLAEIAGFGEQIRSMSDCIISIGIGGSYLGARASLEFLISQQKIPIHFAGHNLSSGYLSYLLQQLRDLRVSVIVISKSGRTTEPALAFRIIKEFMKTKYSSKELKKRIICITDGGQGALRTMVNEEGYKSYQVDQDVGGRFSVLTPVGLVPLAIAGINIQDLINGARLAQEKFSHLDFEENIAYCYAASRYILYNKGKVIETLSTFYNRLSVLGEWWKQLFGESEGKLGKGIYPSSLSFTTDLHSMGQLLQEGARNVFETFLIIENPGTELLIPKEDKNIDQFNYVAGKDLDYVNKKAYEATALAHFEGGVPNMTIMLKDGQASSLGQLYYFFERAVAMTGYLMDVNPFNQPGVEAYKKNMVRLLKEDV